jgi:hypothetical protein
LGVDILTDPEPTDPYTELDETLFELFSKSQRPYLSKVDTYYLGNPKLKAEIASMDIAQSGDRNNSESFDSEERLLTYVLILHIKNFDYLKARRIMARIIADIKYELKTNLIDKWRWNFTIGDIIPIYNDQGVLRKAEVQVLFKEEEDDYFEDETFENVGTRGELIND